MNLSTILESHLLIQVVFCLKYLTTIINYGTSIKCNFIKNIFTCTK